MATMELPVLFLSHSLTKASAYLNSVAVFDAEAEERSRIDDVTVDRIYDIDTDAQGHIWLATDAGVVML